MSFLSALSFDTARITKESLKRLNIAIAALLFIQAVVLLLIGNSAPGSRPVTLGYTSRDALSSVADGQSSYLPATHHFFDISLLYILAFTLLVAAVAHLWAATVARSTYENDLDNGLNRLRWRLSALTSGLVMVSIALLVGVNDLALLILIFGATAGSNLLALLTEQLTQRLQAGERLRFWAGIMPAIGAWLAVAIYVKSSYIYGTNPPSYIYIIPAVMLALFILTVVTRYKQFIKDGPWVNYMYAERTYLVLNLVSLSALTWMVYGWLLR